MPYQSSPTVPARAEEKPFAPATRRMPSASRYLPHALAESTPVPNTGGYDTSARRVMGSSVLLVSAIPDDCCLCWPSSDRLVLFPAVCSCLKISSTSASDGPRPPFHRVRLAGPLYAKRETRILETSRSSQLTTCRRHTLSLVLLAREATNSPVAGQVFPGLPPVVSQPGPSPFQSAYTPAVPRGNCSAR